MVAVVFGEPEVPVDYQDYRDYAKDDGYDVAERRVAQQRVRQVERQEDGYASEEEVQQPEQLLEQSLRVERQQIRIRESAAFESRAVEHLAAGRLGDNRKGVDRFATEWRNVDLLIRVLRLDFFRWFRFVHMNRFARGDLKESMLPA